MLIGSSYKATGFRPKRMKKSTRGRDSILLFSGYMFFDDGTHFRGEIVWRM